MATRGRDNMEHDTLIRQYSHLNMLPREKDAILALQKIASLVKPIMRARNWKVGTLAEFYPPEQNLLGINVNRGQKICVRLRYPGDQNQFLPMEQVVDTMLHELSHNVHGPHDAKFHALWDQLRKEYEGLLSKGYTGEGFMSDGHRLGGRGNLPRHEASRIARLAAEKRRTLGSGSGQKLGGRSLQAGADIRRVIVDAIERRNTVLKGCGSNSKNDNELKDLGHQATSNGFKTKADEDAANERAIAQALWELVQEEEKKAYGKDYIAPTPADPTGNGGGEIGLGRPIKKEDTPSASTSNSLPIRRPNGLGTDRSSKDSKTKSSSTSSFSNKVASKPLPTRRPSDRPISRLVSEQPPTKKAKPSIPTPPSETFQSLSSSFPNASPPLPAAPIGWTCPLCTLHNTIESLACDACTSERPAEITLKLVTAEKARMKTQMAAKKLWRCHRCSTEMEDQWWTCSKCFTVKSNS